MTKESNVHTGKVRVDLLPPAAMFEVANAIASGIEKHGARDWEKGMPWSVSYGCLLRHLLRFWARDDQDKDSGLLAMAHVAARALFLLHYQMHKIGTDDRPGLPPPEPLKLFFSEKPINVVNLGGKAVEIKSEVGMSYLDEADPGPSFDEQVAPISEYDCHCATCKKYAKGGGL